MIGNFSFRISNRELRLSCINRRSVLFHLSYPNVKIYFHGMLTGAFICSENACILYFINVDLSHPAVVGLSGVSTQKLLFSISTLNSLEGRHYALEGVFSSLRVEYLHELFRIPLYRRFVSSLLRVYVCMYICAYMYIRMCMHALHMYVCVVCVHVWTCVHIGICMHACMYARVYVHMYVLMGVHMCVHTYVRTCTYVHTYYVCMCICVYVCV